MAKFERNEDKLLEELKQYIASTYSQHYVTDGQLQTIDIWESLGIAEDVCKGTAIKYLMRYGKKNGKNKADLLKAMHYIILMIHYSNNRPPENKIIDFNSKMKRTFETFDSALNINEIIEKNKNEHINNVIDLKIGQ